MRSKKKAAKRRRADSDCTDNEAEYPDMALEEPGTGDEEKNSYFEVSQPTKALLQMAFCMSAPADNKVCKNWLAKFSAPAGDETRCPKLDAVMKTQLKKEVVENDRKLSRLQNFALDATGPMVAALEEATSEGEGPPNMDFYCQLPTAELNPAGQHFLPFLPRTEIQSPRPAQPRPQILG